MTRVKYLPNIECKFEKITPGDFFTTKKNALCLKIISETGRDFEPNAVYIRTGKQKFFESFCEVIKHQSVRIEVC